MTTLLKQFPQYLHVGTTSEPAGLARALGVYRPDVLVLDQELAEAVGEDCGTEHHPRVLLISSRQHVGLDAACGHDCACGLVPDSAPVPHIRAALKIIGSCHSSKLGEGYCNSCPLRGSLRPPPLPLSSREQEVFLRIGLGESNQQIAAHFGRSVKTIETHRENIKRKLGLDNGAALVEAAMAWRRGEVLIRSAQRPALPGPAALS
ncbi:response regulator transcription factor [Arenimonas sp.]|uniref:response regulator transcription factor n=1 Tax=Arenimonas sp. TaxID=1872635 RepID=UPI0035B2BAAC